MKILIIEDEQDFVSELANRLSRRGGHDVKVAHDGEDGWKLFANSDIPFDFILTDVKMPLLDGIGLLQRLRDESYEIPVILMTGHGDLDISIKAIKLGAFDFLVKPFPIKELDAVIAKLEMFHASQQQLHQLLPQMEESLELTIPSQTGLVYPLINYFHKHYDQLCQLYHINSHQIDLCLYEALNNAIIHGNFGISSEVKEESWDKFDNLVKEREENPEYAQKKVILRYFVKGDQMNFEIEDEGNGFEGSDSFDLSDPDSLMNSGRGLVLIFSIMDYAGWNQKRNCIKIMKELQNTWEMDSFTPEE